MTRLTATWLGNRTDPRAVQSLDSYHLQLRKQDGSEGDQGQGHAASLWNNNWVVNCGFLLGT